MATNTPNYGLKKPEINDFYNFEDQNGNMDIIDAELAKRMGKTDAADGLKVAFTAAASRTLPATGETLAVLWGKVLKWLSDLGTAAFSAATDFAAAVHKHTKADITDFPASMTPSVHAPTHAKGGSDPVTPGAIGAATRISGTATLSTANWSGSAAPYAYAFSVPGILATDTPHVDRVTGTDSSAAALINTAWQLLVGCAVKAQSGNGTITFYATAKPTTNIPIMWEVNRS